MARIKTIFRLLERKLKGSLSAAIDDGMTVGKDVTVMGGVDFGSEPYLITLGDNVRISSDVRFVTHDGGTWAFRNFYEDMQDVIKFGPIVVEGGGVCWRRKHNYAWREYWKPRGNWRRQHRDKERSRGNGLGRDPGTANLYSPGVC